MIKELTKEQEEKLEEYKTKGNNKLRDSGYLPKGYRDDNSESNRDKEYERILEELNRL